MPEKPLKRLQIDRLLSSLVASQEKCGVQSESRHAPSSDSAPANTFRQAGVYVHGIDVWPRLQQAVEQFDINQDKNLVAALLDSRVLCGLGRSVERRLENLSRFVSKISADQGGHGEFGRLVRELQVPLLAHMIRRASPARNFNEPVWQCLLSIAALPDKKQDIINDIQNTYLLDEQVFERHLEAMQGANFHCNDELRTPIQDMFESTFNKPSD